MTGFGLWHKSGRASATDKVGVGHWMADTHAWAVPQSRTGTVTVTVTVHLTFNGLWPAGLALAGPRARATSNSRRHSLTNDTSTIDQVLENNDMVMAASGLRPHAARNMHHDPHQNTIVH